MRSASDCGQNDTAIGPVPCPGRLIAAASAAGAGRAAGSLARHRAIVPAARAGAGPVAGSEWTTRYRMAGRGARRRTAGSRWPRRRSRSRARTRRSPGSPACPRLARATCKPGVPNITPAAVTAAASTAREMPKSITRGPSAASSTLGGLEVAVHHPAGVDGLQRLDQPGQQRPQRGLGQRAVLADHLVQRGTRHERRGQPGRPFVQPAGHDRRGVDPADRPGRATPTGRSGAGTRRHWPATRCTTLIGDGPAGRGQPEVDPAHAARAEQPAQPVLADHPRVVRRQSLHASSRCRARPRLTCAPLKNRSDAAHDHRRGLPCAPHSAVFRAAADGLSASGGKVVGEVGVKGR